jgi:hypothetical protein
MYYTDTFRIITTPLWDRLKNFALDPTDLPTEGTGGSGGTSTGGTDGSDGTSKDVPESANNLGFLAIGTPLNSSKHR